eukprot:TRINITY_DN26092_c0_g3_i1.p1 TRINITY_DN26092_c0_g3~~TRINITY_DN26092_c0_g3_i1.p1  ORF type:complete len:491 (-),score=100.98 TRINITY_DN26092_c0_g3_i1:73-1545(-)
MGTSQFAAGRRCLVHQLRQSEATSLPRPSHSSLRCWACSASRRLGRGFLQQCALASLLLLLTSAACSPKALLPLSRSWRQPDLGYSSNSRGARSRSLPRVLSDSFELLLGELQCSEEQARTIVLNIQRYAVATEGDDSKGGKTRRLTRRVVRGVEQHVALRETLLRPGGVQEVIQILNERSERHTERFDTISAQHEALREGREGDMKTYSDAATYFGNEWWVRVAHSQIITALDRYFLLSPEQVQRGHPKWAADYGGNLPAGWKKYKLKGRFMYWNPEEKRMQIQAPQKTEALPAPPPREPPVQLLDIGSNQNRFADDSFFVNAHALDLQPSEAASGQVLQADFLKVPIADSEDAEENQRFILNEDGSLKAIVAGSFDVVVLSLVLSFVPSAEQRIEMVAKARRCLRDDRGLLFVVEAGSTLKDSWYDKDIATEWSKAMERAGFRVIHFDTEVKEQRREKSVLQWVLETAPVTEASRSLSPLVVPRQLPW